MNVTIADLRLLMGPRHRAETPHSGDASSLREERRFSNALVDTVPIDIIDLPSPFTPASAS